MDERREEPQTDFGQGGVGTDTDAFVGTDNGISDRDRLVGVSTPDDEGNHGGTGDIRDAAPAAAGVARDVARPTPNGFGAGRGEPSGGLMSGDDSMDDALEVNPDLAAGNAGAMDSDFRPKD